MESPKRSKKSKGDKKSKKSGVRTKFLIESLRNEYYSLRDENDRLRGIVKDNMEVEISDQVLAECFDLNANKGTGSLDELAAKSGDADLDEDDDDM